MRRGFNFFLSAVVLIFIQDNVIVAMESKILINDVFDYYTAAFGHLIDVLEVNKTIDVPAIVKEKAFPRSNSIFGNGTLNGISNVQRHGNMYLGLQYPVNILGELLLPKVHGFYQSSEVLPSGEKLQCNVSYSYVNTVMKFNMTQDPFISLKSRIILTVPGELNVTKATVDSCTPTRWYAKVKPVFEQALKENQKAIIDKIASEMSEKIAPRVTEILPKLAQLAAVEMIENFGIKLDPYFSDDDSKFHLDIHVAKNSNSVSE